MTIIERITKTSFRDAFNQLRPDNFSYEGLGHLYDYLEQLSEDIGQPIELDVIATCCDYSEESIYDVLDNYGLESIEELEEQTSVIMHNQQEAIVLYRVF